jgi:DNA-binding NarL/FixJ family response regulator
MTFVEPRRSHSKSRRRVARRTPKPAPARIAVADGQAIDRRGLVRLLEDEFEVVGEAVNLGDAIRRCRALAPDVLVLSLNLPGQEKQAAIPALRAVAPELRIVALSERGAANCLVLNPPYRQQTAAELELLCANGLDCLQFAAAQGAMATVRRSAEPEDLFRAIRCAAAGEAWYDPTTAKEMLIATGPKGRRRGAHAGLSAKELEVAALIAEGRSNKEISSALGIREATVKKHVGHILGKLGLADRLNAGLLLARNPLILARR